jgi:hypothetical protein
VLAYPTFNELQVPKNATLIPCSTTEPFNVMLVCPAKLVKPVPLRLHRRQLHVLQPSKGGKRRSYGGTRSLGLKRGSLVKHKRYGLCYVGGSMCDRISVHCCVTGTRVSQRVKPEECEVRTFSMFRISSTGAKAP